LNRNESRGTPKVFGAVRWQATKIEIKEMNPEQENNTTLDAWEISAQYWDKYRALIAQMRQIHSVVLPSQLTNSTPNGTAWFHPVLPAGGALFAHLSGVTNQIQRLPARAEEEDGTRLRPGLGKGCPPFYEHSYNSH
jgi:hypothetical protein